jgi:hypothetical protein
MLLEKGADLLPTFMIAFVDRHVLQMVKKFANSGDGENHPSSVLANPQNPIDVDPAKTRKNNNFTDHGLYPWLI